jgi:hypothetical protein
MSSDFFSLGYKPSSLHIQPDLDALIDVHAEPELKLFSKVILVPLEEKNRAYLSSLKTDQFDSCVFIFLNDSGENLNKWQEIFNLFPPLRVLTSDQINKEKLEDTILVLRERAQKISLQKMLDEDQELQTNQKSIELQELMDLEKKLLRSRKTARQNQLNEKLNLNCLEAIFKSKSIGDIEDHITEILREPFKMDWVRILISPGDILTELPTIKFQNQFNTRVLDLDFDYKSDHKFDHKIQGKVIFASKKEHKFKESSNSLLQKICDAVTLRLKQISTESDIENSKRQWEITFKALPFKAALIDKNYRVLETGGLFNELSPSKKSDLCYKKFFDRSKPCTGCRLGENFLVDQKNESLEVNSKEIFDPVNDEHYYLNFYRDFEISTLGESGQATQTKLEELGIISGSIAHELNNPLGGIRILLELLQDDTNLSKAEYKEDLDILMRSTNKCIDIVQELLNFTRARTKNSGNHVKTLTEYFDQLKVFTQAYLLSEGIILRVVEGPHLKQLINSSDSTLSIKLLEAVAHICKKIKKEGSGSSQDIYLYSQQESEKTLEIIFSSILPTSPKPHTATDVALSIAPQEQAFDESSSVDKGQSLTLKFSTEVALKGTHV